MKVKRYEYRAGYSSAVDPQVAGETLQAEVARANGELSADTLVARARAKRHPLHNCFEWDDDEAANLYRLVQARTLMRAVVVVQEINDEEVSAPLMVHIRKNEMRSLAEPPVGKAGRYVLLNEALSDPDRREVLLRRAKAELEAWRKRYQDLQELAHIFEALDDIAS